MCNLLLGSLFESTLLLRRRRKRSSSLLYKWGARILHMHVHMHTLASVPTLLFEYRMLLS
jgi:hypothetical protein